MRSAITVLIIMATLAAGGAAWGQNDWIGVYADDVGSTCRINDTVSGLVSVYIVQHGSTPSTQSWFRLEQSAGTMMSWLTDIYNVPLAIGNSQAGLTLAYGACVTDYPMLLATALYFGSGTTPRCEWIDVVAHPDAQSGLPEIIDCSFNTVIARSSRAVINPSLHCVCTGVPEIVPITTVTTDPVGLDVTVDGVTYQSPQSFEWDEGTAHTIGASSPQGAVDSLFTFSGWSDGGTQTHIITAPAVDATFTATFDLSPRFRIATAPPGRQIVADANAYVAPKNFYWPPGSVHDVSTPSPQAGVDSAYIFESWSDGGAIAHSVTAPGIDTLLTAIFSGIPNNEPGAIRLYSDAAGSTCNFMDDTPQTATVYVVHVGFGGATQSRFRVRSGGGFGCTYLGETSPLLVSGDTQSGLQAPYGGCQAGDLLVAQIDYQCTGTSSPCSYLEIVPDPAATSGLVEVRDCSNNALNATSSRLYVNPDGSCACGEYVLPSRDVVVNTEPEGLDVVVDGTSHTTPQQFAWLDGSTHTVDAPAQQSNMQFLTWNDGGGRSHAVEVGESDLNLIATYFEVAATGEAISVYADVGAGSCQLVDTQALVTAYVVHTGAASANGSQFMLYESAGMNMSFLNAQLNPDFLSLGDIRTGITITYVGCRNTFPLLLATLTYFGSGTSDPCSFLEIVPDPAAESGEVEVVSCQYEIRTASGGRATINTDGSCVCGPPAGGPAQATVTTTPPGLTVTVDSVSYTSPQDFDWDAGTTHTISVAASQTYNADSIAVFSYWSDGGARTHEVTMPDGSVTYRATHNLRSGVTSGVGGDAVPPVVVLRQNAPNPFNPVTRIDFSLPNAGQVRLHVYDVRGRLVRRLYEGSAPSGYTSLYWDGLNDQGRSVGSGVYFYRLQAGSETVTRKMVLLK